MTVPTVIARLTLVIAVIERPSPVPHLALLPWSKLDGELIQLYLNAGDMGRDQLLIAEQAGARCFRTVASVRPQDVYGRRQ
jgi:hypothetical protein